MLIATFLHVFFCRLLHRLAWKQNFISILANQGHLYTTGLAIKFRNTGFIITEIQIYAVKNDRWIEKIRVPFIHPNNGTYSDSAFYGASFSVSIAA